MRDRVGLALAPRFPAGVVALPALSAFHEPSGLIVMWSVDPPSASIAASNLSCAACMSASQLSLVYEAPPSRNRVVAAAIA